MVNYYADEVIFDDPIPELNLPAGSSLKTVILSMVQKQAEIEQMIKGELYPAGQNGITAKDIKYETIISGGMGLEAQKIDGSEIKVKLERGPQAADVTVNARDFITLPEGAKIVSSVLNITGQKENGRTQIVPSSKQPIMNVSVPYSRFPITVDARVVVNTVDGDVELRKTVQVISDESIEQMTKFETIDRTSKPVAADLEAAMKQVETRLKHLETKKA